VARPGQGRLKAPAADGLDRTCRSAFVRHHRIDGRLWPTANLSSTPASPPSRLDGPQPAACSSVRTTRVNACEHTWVRFRERRGSVERYIARPTIGEALFSYRRATSQTRPNGGPHPWRIHSSWGSNGAQNATLTCQYRKAIPLGFTSGGRWKPARSCAPPPTVAGAGGRKLASLRPDHRHHCGAAVVGEAARTAPTSRALQHWRASNRGRLRDLVTLAGLRVIVPGEKLSKKLVLRHRCVAVRHCRDNQINGRSLHLHQSGVIVIHEEAVAAVLVIAVA
jgi:hypothetical protein